MTPAQFYTEQWRFNKKEEDRWEHTRQIVAMIHNGSPNKKKNVKPEQIVEISKDRKKNRYEFDSDWWQKANEMLQDKRNQN